METLNCTFKEEKVIKILVMEIWALDFVWRRIGKKAECRQTKAGV